MTENVATPAKAKTHAARAKTSASKRAAKSAAKKKRAAKKPLPTCTARDLKKKKSKRRACRVPAKRDATKATAIAAPKTATATPTPTPTRPSPSGPVAAPPATSSSDNAFPTAFVPDAAGDPGVAAPYPGLTTYRGTFGVREAQRLLLRAGFGPTPGQAEALAKLGLEGAVASLMNPGTSARVGPAPTGAYLVDGAFSPGDLWGHLHLDFLDRAVRSTDPLTERMTLVLHDWFGVSAAGADLKLVVGHLNLLRTSWRGSFRALVKAVAVDPAMLLFLNGNANRRGAPNENFARELMELYALGPDRGAYTEDDVRELARAFTGWRNDWSQALGNNNFRFDPTRFDGGTKSLFPGTPSARSGALSLTDGVDAVIDHALHPSFVVLKLWSSFIPSAPSAQTQAGLEALYRQSGEQLAPLVQAILLHPDLHAGPAMTKPPVVFEASLLRARGSGVDSDAWAWRCNNAGQMIGYPPNVAGWNDRAWLNTSTIAARWAMVTPLTNAAAVKATAYTGVTETSQQALDAALAWWGNPVISADHHDLLARIANRTWAKGTIGDPYGNAANFNANRQNVLRQLVPCGPDFQVS